MERFVCDFIPLRSILCVLAVTVAVAQQIENDNRQKKQKTKEEKRTAVSFAFFVLST